MIMDQITCVCFLIFGIWVGIKLADEIDKELKLGQQIKAKEKRGHGEAE